jgi:hypothetical protein
MIVKSGGVGGREHVGLCSADYLTDWLKRE